MQSASAALMLVTVGVLCLLQWSVVSCDSEKNRLVRDITRNYLKSIEPDNVVLKTKFSIICARYDKTAAELTTNAWEQLTWTDERLRWNPKAYGEIKTIRLPSNLIWRPDLKLYNSISPIDERDQTNVVVMSDGTVIWVPSVLYKTLCSGDSDDTGLNCQLRVGTWTYDADTVKLELSGDGVTLDSYENSTCPVTFDRATAVLRTKHYPCCKEPYSHVEINLHVKPESD